MSMRYKGGILSATAPTTSTAQSQPGMWTMRQEMQAQAAGLWPTPPVTGCITYTSPGTYSWVAPTGVTRVSIVAIGGGGSGNGFSGGGGGGLGWRNNKIVSPGSSYSVTVGAGGYKPPGCSSYYAGGQSVAICTYGYGGCQNGGGYSGCGGGNGGNAGGFCYYYSGGGGAGGYSGNGGNGGQYACGAAGANGSGGGGGGGAANSGSGGGGGTQIYGQGANGVGGSGSPYRGGGRGSCGSGTTFAGRCGQAYGGGAGSANPVNSGNGGSGAVRIVWPGCSRLFPSTNVGP